MLFERLTLAPDQPRRLDLSAEASLDGCPTTFTILDEQKLPASPEKADVAGGLITFHQKGRYRIMMSNDRVVSHLADQPQPRKVKACTGWIDVE